ncbi:MULTISPECIES: site-2 protease family protein [Sulfurimonas]|uniref:Site-2 protease family protein n=1 Tax=Sulfurimonas diazotrophicus TaxID=3131939 RepID=A0ABZ3HCN7_9BACT
MDSIDLLKIASSVIALAIAIIGHEIMHGWVAYRYGDTTAKHAGRLSINPLIHIDPVGTILVPLMMYFIPMLLGMGGGFLFGWAKPVPVNMRTVIANGGYSAAMQVSLAGIAYNFALASLFAVVLTGIHQPLQSDGLGYIFLYLVVMQLVFINVLLAVFNLLPIPQFDGAHFLMFLSLKYGLNNIAMWFQRLEPYGMFIVIIILITPLREYVLFMPVQYVLHLLLS